MAVHDLVYQLRQGLDRFSPVERRIADAILADIPAAAQSGVGELAQRAGVSVAAVSRFAKALGCAHVRELRARLAEAGAVGRRFLDEAQAAPLPVLHAQIADDLDAAVRRNLAGLSESVVQGLAGALAVARRIHVFGMGGSSAVFGQELQHRLTRLGLPAAACSDAVAMRMLAATLQERFGGAAADAVRIATASTDRWTRSNHDRVVADGRELYARLSRARRSGLGPAAPEALDLVAEHHEGVRAMWPVDPAAYHALGDLIETDAQQREIVGADDGDLPRWLAAAVRAYAVRRLGFRESRDGGAVRGSG